VKVSEAGEQNLDSDTGALIWINDYCVILNYEWQSKGQDL
jgi:hypothetical protein